MWNEDNEAVETVSADAAPEGGSEAEVETSASEPMDVAADTAVVVALLGRGQGCQLEAADKRASLADATLQPGRQ